MLKLKPLTPEEEKQLKQALGIGAASTIPGRIKIKIDRIIEEQLQVSSISPSQRLVEDLGADSLDVVELIMAFEDEFGVSLPDEDIAKMKTVEDVVKFVSSLK